jgi:hypothetical protein
MLDSCFLANGKVSVEMDDCVFGLHSGGRAVLNMIQVG